MITIQSAIAQRPCTTHRRDARAVDAVVVDGCVAAAPCAVGEVSGRIVVQRAVQFNLRRVVGARVLSFAVDGARLPRAT